MEAQEKGEDLYEAYKKLSTYTQDDSDENAYSKFETTATFERPT